VTRKIILLLVLLLLGFLAWRFIRPLNIFVITDAFDRPVDTSGQPKALKILGAKNCAICHPAFYAEWRTTIHSQAWTDPYFQTDWQFDKSQQVCRNCHTPLDRQQPSIILGFRDKDKWDPILKPNPDFDPNLQHEGVTCTGCHLRDGRIVGVHGIQDAPHPVQQLDDPNEVCVRCHVVEGERWDTFFRFPPCGTVAEIRSTLSDGKTGETIVPDSSSLGCVQCHMPLVERPLVKDGKVRQTRRHLWRGGHDPAMVKQGLNVAFTEDTKAPVGSRTFKLTISNIGATHYIPTGTPDRYLSVDLRLLDAGGGVLKKDHYTLRRTVMWRPFIVDLWDTRLPRGEPHSYTLSVAAGSQRKAAAVEAIVRYHLLDESRRKRIGYTNKEPVFYEVFHRRISLNPG